MDWVWSSKTGSKLRPAFSDFQTPPLAAPTQMVTGSVAFAVDGRDPAAHDRRPDGAGLEPTEGGRVDGRLGGVGDKTADQQSGRDDERRV